MKNAAELFLIALAIQIAAACVIPLVRKTAKASAAAHMILIMGLVCGLAVSVSSLLSLQMPLGFTFIPGKISSLLRFDSLGLFFLAVIQLVAIPTCIYSYSYFGHYREGEKPVKSTLIFFIALLVSTQMIAVSDHAILFLVFWEAMSTTAYLGMIFDNEKKDVQSGSFYYLIISHVAMYLLFVFFILMHHQCGSWHFSDFHVSPDAGPVFIVLFMLAFVAFGIKAGFMPFHFWLPRAHPIAPTVLSAFLSGVIIKMGIYGILRTFQFLSPAPEWIGWLILIVSAVSAVFGVWYALAQHDLKSLLAYHSVENIGIIGIGIGIGFIGAAHDSLHLQFLGFGGALLHTLNHAVFKNLLFIGSGIINQNLGTRNIDHMGGLVHRAKYFAALFLIGSVAICGIPPLNGFVSEFIIFNGFFSVARELKQYYPLLMLLFTVALAFVGGLAVACFSKVNAIIFLGSPRKTDSDFRVTRFDYAALGILASLCVAIGFFPLPFVSVINRVLANGYLSAGGYKAGMIDVEWGKMSFVFALLFGGTVVIYLVKILLQKRSGRRDSAAWGCGYPQTPRMQYTASSYADDLNEIAGTVLRYEKNMKSSHEIVPPPAHFESHAHDLIDSRIIVPGFRRLNAFVSRLEFMSFTDIRYYIAFILVIISIYCLMAFIWA